MLICDREKLGITIGYFPDRDNVYLKYTITRTSCYKIKGCKNKIKGDYIVQIKTPQLLL